MKKVISYVDEGVIGWILPETVNSTILDSLIEEVKKDYSNNKNAYNNIILDFSKIRYIDIQGALALICFCSAIKRKNSNTNFRFIYPSKNVLSYLITLGFFGHINNKVGAIDRQDIVHNENELKSKRLIHQKLKANYDTANTIILPIETIPEQTKDLSGFDFEHMVRTFANHAIDTFDVLQTSTQFNFSGEDYYRFRQSNIELYKNIFHHSESWGIASIHARPNHGTTVCYYDIGIGFKASVKKFETEAESIEWALIDGNTSKPNGDNDGYGFTLIQEFVLKRKGTISIRSGNCLLHLNSNLKPKKSIVSRFRGAQICYFIPT